VSIGILYESNGGKTQYLSRTQFLDLRKTSFYVYFTFYFWLGIC